MGAQSKQEIPPWGCAGAGAAGAVLANALVYPLDIVKTRLQVQVRPGESTLAGDDEPHYASTWDAVQRIVADDGIRGLYAGMNGSLIGVASINFSYFYWYTLARSFYLKSFSIPASSPSTAVELSLGTVAGALAQLFTIPVAVVTTRQQTAKGHERKSLLATARELVDGPDGVTGLWRGLKASLVLVVNPAITYGAYERLRGIFFPGESRLKPWQAFFLGALSKALTTIATQPLIVAKVGLQSKPPRIRNGKPFKSFTEVMKFIVEHEKCPRFVKGDWTPDLQGAIGARHPHDDQGKSRAPQSFPAVYPGDQKSPAAESGGPRINSVPEGADIATVRRLVAEWRAYN